MPDVTRPGVCPFCGMVSEVPHETQAGCIEALRHEVQRTRRVLDGTSADSNPDRDGDLELT